MWKPHGTNWAFGLILMLTACGSDSPGGAYPPHPREDFSREKELAGSDRHPFRFPLVGLDERPEPVSCVFGAWGGPVGGRKYHAAEDYAGPPGTPVYAMADGQVSFSGRAGGYGWLIIVDHPGPNLYSLYGHLSPSRWRRAEGPVGKGDLLGYLGDPHENGGSRKNPLHPHLHFGIRAGLRTDYPGKGEWRWQAGWIRPRPTDVGWLRPSVVINARSVPPGGFTRAAGGLFEVWGVELALGGAYVLGGACVLVSATRRRKPVLLFIAAVVCLAIGWYFGHRGMQLAWIQYAMAAILAAAWVRSVLTLRRGLRRSSSVPL